MLLFRFIIIPFVLLCACSSSNKIKDADTAIRLKKYFVAIELLLDKYEQTKNKADKAKIAFNLATCYSSIAQYTNSLKWFKKAYDFTHSNAHLLAYANALKRNEDYKEAQEAFVELSNEAVGGSLYRKEATVCKLAQEWKKKVYPDFYYKISVLPFNEASNEYGPFYDATGTLFLTSDRIGSIGRKKYQWSGQFFSDLYKVNEHSELVSVDFEINTENNEGGGSISSGNKEIYFTRCSDLNVGDYYCQIYSKSLIHLKEPEVLLELGGEKSNNIHPAIHYSDTILVFSSDRDNGVGGFDLYSTILKNGEWTEPKNLGKSINTEGNEKFPSWNKDTLFFSSDFHPGMGGLDIFKTWLTPQGNWASVQHLDYPINTGSDDFCYAVDPHFVPTDSVVRRAVFSSNRNPNSGDDIYEVLTVLKSHQSKKKAIQNNIVKINYFKAMEYALDVKISPLDSVSVLLNNSGEVYSSGNLSTLTFEFYSSDSVMIQSGRNGYLNNTLKIGWPIIKDLVNDTTVFFEFNVILYPFQFNKEFLLKDVLYDFDKYNLREESLISLGNLVNLLLSNPKISVEISSHTDCRGDELYNLELSNNRAESVVKFLISKGISKDRLSFKGYGESHPVALCKCEACGENEHQMNRRSTFKLVKNE